MQNNQIIINTRAVVIGIMSVSGIVAAAALLWFLKDLIILIFVALIFALTLEPMVEYLVKKKIPRSGAVLMVLATTVLLIGGLSSIAIVPFTIQVQSLVKNFPYYLSVILSIVGINDANQISNTLATQLSQTSGTIIAATFSVFSGLLSLVVTFVFTLYIMFDLHNLRIKFIEIFPVGFHQEVRVMIVEIERKLGGWLRGQLLLVMIIGVATFIGLLILGLPYALALAVIAGLLEVVPVIGPILAAIPAMIIGFSVNWVTGVGAIVLYLIIQQLENNLIVPKVMQKAVGFNPLVTIIALMVGSKFLGVVGAIISIPITIIIFEIYKLTMKYSFPNSNN